VCVTAEVSTFLHACEGDAVAKLTNEKVPYFNAPIYLQNKTQIGKVDEIFGPINESVSASWISLRDCKTLPAPGDLTVRWVSCVCIGSFFC
jgi:H/ACA ribonucleoprotein complex subunit 1